MRRADILRAALLLAAGAVLSASPARAGGSPPALQGTPTVVPATVDVSDGPKTVHIEFHLTDDVGVTGALVGFYHEDPEFLPFLASATLDSGTPTNGIWSADVLVEQTGNGLFRLWVQAWDADSQLEAETNVTLTVTGGDEDKPELAGDIVLDPAVVNLAGGPAPVTVTVPLNDLGYGVEYVEVYVRDDDFIAIAYGDAALIDGTINDGVWRANLEIPANTAAGSYQVQILVEDIPGNSIEIEGPDLVVASGGDTTLPALVGEMTVEPDTVDVSTEDRGVLLRAHLVDAAGVAFVNAVLEDSSGSQFTNDFLEIIEGDSLDGVWGVTLTIGQGSPPGVYALRLDADDVSGNMAMIETGRSVTISGGDDVEAPVLIPPLDITPDTADVSNGSVVVMVRTGIMDNRSGAESAIARFHRGSALSSGALTKAEGDSLSGVWEGPVTIPAGAAEGTDSLTIDVTDYDQNSAARLTTARLIVRNSDVSPPALSGTAMLDPIEVDVSGGAQTVNVTFTLTDDRSGVDQVTAELRPIGPGVWLTAPAMRASGDSLNGGWQAEITIPADTPRIVLALWIVADDRAANRAEIDTGVLLQVERDVEAMVEFRVDFRGPARLGLLNPDFDRVLLDVFDSPAPAVLTMGDVDRDTVYVVQARIRVDAAIRYAFAFDPGVPDSSQWLYEKGGRTAGRELLLTAADAITLPTVLFDDRPVPAVASPEARVRRVLVPPLADSIAFDDGTVFTDVVLRNAGLARSGVAAVRRYAGGPDGALPAGIVTMSTAAWWRIAAFTGGDPLTAAVDIAWDLYGGVTDPGALRWLHRASPAEPWTVVPTVLDAPGRRVRSGGVAPDGEWTLGSTSSANPLTPEPPAVPSGPNPPDGALLSAGLTTLAWLPAAGALTYDVRVWPSDEDPPGLPTIAGLRAAEFTIFEALPLLTEWRWSVTARNRAGASPGPVWSFRVDDGPDLIVESIEAPAEAFAGQEIELRIVVRNQGNEATNAAEWYDQVYFSRDFDFDPRLDTFLKVAANTAWLAPGESYAAVVTVTIPESGLGDSYLFVTTDAFAALFETNETNNFHGQPILVKPALQADLEIATFTGPAFTFSGRDAALTWRVRNRGERDTGDPLWVDTIHLSADSVLDAVDPILGYAWQVDPLPVDSAYSASLAVALPDTVIGSVWLILVCDAYQAIAEKNEGAGNQRSLPLEITLTPPPDLVPTSLTAPATAASGRTIQVGWTVQNQGPGNTPGGSWSDRLTLVPGSGASHDSVFVLGSRARSAVLTPDSTVADSAIIRIPDGLSGTWSLTLTADWDNRVFEYQWETNNRREIDLPVTLSPWPDLNPVFDRIPGVVTAGDPLDAAWSIGNAGDAPAAARWIDRIYICPEAVWDSTAAVLLGAVERTADLATGEEYATISPFRVPPDLAAGTGYFHLRADEDRRVYEHTDEGNNNLASGPVTIEALPVDLIVSGVAAPDAGGSGQMLSVTWTAANGLTGTTLSGTWFDAAFLSVDAVLDPADVRLAEFQHVDALRGGETYTRTAPVPLPNGVSGAFFLIVRTDARDQVIEASNSNNASSAQAIQIALTPPPDLRVDEIAAPASVAAGQPFTFTRRTGNHGAGPTTAAFRYDGAWLSKNATADDGDIRLGSSFRGGSIAAGGAETDTVTVFVPSWAAGNYYLIARADVRDDVYEHNAEDNNTRAVLVDINLPPPTDLVATGVIVPSNAVPGDSITVSWILENRGTARATGFMTEGIYVSADTVWTIDDPLVALEDRSIDIPGGGAVMMSARISLDRPESAAADGTVRRPFPGLVPGHYRAVVRPNIRNTIRETDPFNNTGVSADSVAVGVPVLPFDVPTAAMLAESGMRYWRLDVEEDGLTVAVTLDGEPGTSNELYVRYGAMPTRSAFDLAGGSAFSPDQEIVIPGTTIGSYYVMAFGDRVPEGGRPITVLARRREFDLRAVSPAEGGRGGRVTLTVSGTAIEPGVELSLVNGATAIPATRTRWLDAARVYATFDLGAAPEGTYDLRGHQEAAALVQTTNPDTVLAILRRPGDAALPGAFRVAAPSNRRIDIRRSGQKIVRVSHGFEVTVEAANLSNQDRRAPLLIVFGKPDFPKGIDAGHGLFKGTRLFLVTAPEGPAGILPPGAVGRLDISGVAPGLPVILDVEVDDVDSGRYPFDFDVELARAGVDPGRPAWSEAVEVLRARGIHSWSDYADLLAETASDLGLRAAAPNEAEELLLRALEAARRKILYPAGDVPFEEPAIDATEIGSAAGEAGGDRFLDDPPLATENHKPPDCSAGTLVQQHAALNVVSSTLPAACAPGGGYHLKKFLLGDGSKITWGTNSHAAFLARRFDDAAQSIKAIHAYVSGQLRFQLEQHFQANGCDARTLPAFQFSVPKPSFYRPGKGNGIGFCDDEATELQTMFGGMQSAKAEVRFLETNVVKFRECEEGCVISYSATIHYTFGDKYEFDKKDVQEGLLDGYGHNLQSCGAAKPFESCLVMDEPVFGRIVVTTSEDDCPEPEPQDPWEVQVVGSLDPNDIIGPAGEGDGRWIAKASTLPYTIRYENDPMKATAPAQIVTITQTLDPEIDVRSFRLGPFGFGSFRFEPPANTSYYTGRLDVRDSLGVFVEVNAGIDVTRGEVFWSLQSIDPAGGGPPANPLAGFLPVNDAIGRGQGFVSYSARPRPDSRTGDRIDAEALIVFDSNPAIETPEIFNTIDADAPRSRVELFPATVDTTVFTVRWTGSDSTGSGVGRYTLFRSDDGGPLEVLQEGIEGTSLAVTGAFGHTYGFQVVAVDRTGNREPAKSAVEASVRLVPGGGAPAAFAVSPNAPNPFRTTTVIRFDLPRAADVEVRVYDTQGRLVMSRLRGELAAGPWTEEIDLSDRASGIYFAEIRATFTTGAPLRKVRKMVLAK